MWHLLGKSEKESSRGLRFSTCRTHVKGRIYLIHVLTGPGYGFLKGLSPALAFDSRVYNVSSNLRKVSRDTVQGRDSR